MKNKSLNKRKVVAKTCFHPMGSFKHLLPTKQQTACEFYKIAGAMHTIVFVDWSIEAKTAQVTNESGIFDGFVPTMMQWCDGASTAIGTKKMTKLTVLTLSRGKKWSFLLQNLMRNAVGGRSWHQVGPS